MLGKAAPRMKSTPYGIGLALSLMDLRFWMSTYVDRRPLSALSCLFLLQTDPAIRWPAVLQSKAQNKGMDRPAFERLPSAPQPQRLWRTGSGSVPPVGVANATAPIQGE